MRILFFFLLTFSLNLSQAQTMIGLWTVDEVLVGDQVLTPVAKWFRICMDSTVQSGNGWTQNNLANWTFDSKKNVFTPINKLTPPDPFGGFKVFYRQGQMIWKRMEEGDSVAVTLSRINELPMAPADSIQGFWKMESQNINTSDSLYSELPLSMHIRPDRLYNLTKPDGSRHFGFWHMDAHAPKFFMISYDKTIKDQVFNVSFQISKLIMKSTTDEIELVYVRQ
ncbi:MAG: hypothetical protein RIC35_07785 [Marinoscillum sp.]